MYNILVCDDERDIVSALKIYLSAENWNVLEAYNGSQALEIIKNTEIHCILMDIMMPVKDGITAVSELRKESNVPVIFLTAKSEDIDMVLGLNIGADDYVTKPFKPIELIARIKSQIRRYTALGGMVKKESLLVCGSITLDDESKTVTRDGEIIPMTPIEYDILYMLMSNPGRVYSSSEIYRHVWNGDAWGGEGTVAVHIRHLREKLEINPSEPRYLKVVWGQGYKITGNG